MANYDLRNPVDYKFGQLSAAATSTATSLTSPGFASLPSGLSSTRYVPITLADDALAVYETVWITAHTASSNTVTVIRARESSSARAWSSGSTWRMAPTIRDVVSPVANRAALPADAHLGMHAALTDELAPVVKTTVGWAVPIGGGNTGRRHSWAQTNGQCGPDANFTITGLTPLSGNGSIATYSTGGLLLNRPGVWAVTLSAYSESLTPGMNLIGMYWSGGAFYGAEDALVKISSRAPVGGVVKTGQLWDWVTWTGYVTAAEAAIPIVSKVNQVHNGSATLFYNFLLSAEYLGG